MQRASRNCPRCEFYVNPGDSNLSFLSIGNGIRKEVLQCGVRDANAKNHPSTNWCAGMQPNRRPGKLFEAVRVYIDQLVASGVLTREMSDTKRIDQVWVVYAVVIWETNGAGGDSGGFVKLPARLHTVEDGNWHGTIFAEGVSIGVPEKVPQSANVVTALRALTKVIRDTKSVVLQAHCRTAHCTDPAPPTALAHVNLLRPPTIAWQDVIGQLFNDLRLAIDAHLLAEKLQSVAATVGAVVAAQQQQAERIDALEQQNGEQAEQIGALQQQVHGLRQHQDEEKEKGEVVRERVLLDVELESKRRASVQVPSTGTAVAGSGSEPDSPASPDASPAAAPAAAPAASPTAAPAMTTPFVSLAPRQHHARR